MEIANFMSTIKPQKSIMPTKKQLPMNLVCVQPSIPYFAWQTEVMLTNFIDLGIHRQHKIICLFAFNRNEPDWEQKVATIQKVERKFMGMASFHFYEDTRSYPFSYISSIRPNILKQHFAAFPELSRQAIFYHDNDILFTRYPDFLDYCAYDDKNWFVSNTESYIGYDYILSKGQDVLDAMCKIVGINPELVKQKNDALQSGGAQYIMKGVDSMFFHKAEKDCERLFKEINELNNQKKQLDPSHHELQIWCADMWAILWGAWMRGYETHIISALDFCWATDNQKVWDEKYIFHNAGVTEDLKDKYFWKNGYVHKYPFLIDIEGYDQSKASYRYAQAIKNIGEKSCLL
jgi:hypothetical protein